MRREFFYAHQIYFLRTMPRFHALCIFPRYLL